MHGGVGAPVQHRGLHLLDEHALAADLVQGHVLSAVTGRLHEDQLGIDAGRAERSGDGLGLGAGLRAPPGRQPEGTTLDHEVS